MYPRLLPVLVTACAMLVACGGGKEQPVAKPEGTGATATPSPPSTPAPAEAPGADAYQVCSTCHQPNGEGVPNAFPPLAGSDYVNGPGDLHIAIVLKGLSGPITVKGQAFNGLMAPWESLSDAQIADAINYERASWGNTGKPVTEAEVAAVRSAVKSRKAAWTVDELKEAKLR
ncbi:MAG TPA: cytochrome c [Gemmatimonadales bacterium]|jgi:mono/diheme cytochrome c family protein|nr:cytochrome c [Gemmatimonadales bacterium]